MSFIYSLKYRIALTIFVIQLIVMGFVLWQTQNASFKETQQLFLSQDQSVVKVLSSVSEASLFNEDFFEIQPFYVRVVEGPHVLTAYLKDYRGDVVVSSDSRLLGESPETPADDDDSYWVTENFENSDDNIGELIIQFSRTELKQTYQDTFQQSILMGLLGVMITALLSIVMGGFLTRRLEQIQENTENFAQGDFDSRCQIQGNDELSSLGRSFNVMADQIKSNMKEVEHLAYHDALTGLANRREFDKRLKMAHKSAQQHGHFYALLFMDLDKFKIVNDTCGHHAGDQLLIQLSDVMLAAVRNRDTLVRFGGDEFGVLLENCSLSQAEEVANKILQAVYDFKFTWEDKLMQVGVSIGVVTLNAKTSNLEHLLSAADAACYTAKQKGRNQVHLVLPGDTGIEDHFTDVDWVNRLSKMIEKDLFKMAFQSIKSMNSVHEVTRMEFLLRMQDENGDIVPPTVFIEAAERFDVIQRLDRYVIDKVFRLIASGKVSSSGVMCFINLSGKSISESSLFNYVRDKIAQYGLDANNICFEITETAAIANFNHASVFIEKARSLGCSFALDDFGSGMCSFVYLKNLQVDYVKIDGQFILNMATNSVDKTIVESINRISHEAGYKTIAEFVENDDIHQQVSEMGIDYAQGYGLHKPQIIEE